MADILDAGFQRDHDSAFDVVYSGGLIEHFTDPRAAIAAHLRILRRGGHLVIGIPNYRGIYGRLIKRDVLDKHNVGIMSLPAFRALFNTPELETLFCGYYGKLNLGLGFGSGLAVSRFLPKLQIAVNILSRIVPLPENRWTSPYLLFIGRTVKCD